MCMRYVPYTMSLCTIYHVHVPCTRRTTMCMHYVPYIGLCSHVHREQGLGRVRNLAGDYVEMKLDGAVEDGEKAKWLAWEALVKTALEEPALQRWRDSPRRWRAATATTRTHTEPEPVDEARCLRTAQGALLPIEEAKALLHRVYCDSDVRIGAPPTPPAPPILTTLSLSIPTLSRTPTPSRPLLHYSTHSRPPLPSRGRRGSGPGLHGERPPLH